MIDEKKIAKWIDTAYGTACEKGFHDEDFSVAHWLMLVLTEVSEVVDADRRNLHADLQKYEDEIKYGADVYDRDTRSPFEKYIKDSVEDELSDVLIRICDTCGTLGIEPLLTFGMDTEFAELFGDWPLCELCFVLSRILCDIDDAVIVSEDNPKCVHSVLSSAFEFVLCLCTHMGIDIERHVELKMRYNALRPFKNGKNY